MRITDKVSVHKFEYEGDPFELFWLLIKNLFLCIITLGIYHPWAVTENRKYIINRLKFSGMKCQYLAKGSDIFKVRMIIFILFFAFTVLGFGSYFLLLNSGISQNVSEITLNFLLPMSYIFIFGLFQFSLKRYQLSQTVFGNYSLGLSIDGRLAYLIHLLIGMFLCIITFGLFYPIMLQKLNGSILNNSFIGGMPIQYQARTSKQYFYILLGAIFSVLTVGMYLPCYLLKIWALKFEDLKVDECSIKFNFSKMDCICFCMLWYFGVLFSFGFAIPYLIHYSIKVIVKALEFEGELQISKGDKNLELVKLKTRNLYGF